MKYLILSDIHGCLPRLQQVLDFYRANHYDMLVILGDILNYGPRNRVPEGMDAPGIVQTLNALADHIVAIRGNCDSEVDQMLLDFPIMADYALLVVGEKRIFLTHGHRYNPDNRPRMGIDAMFFGHTHQWQLKCEEGVVICNTGSITFPKPVALHGETQPACTPTFATIDDDNIIRVRHLDGTPLKEMSI